VAPRAESADQQFRSLFETNAILRMPGVHNGMAALQARSAGFRALYLFGAAMSASLGLPYRTSCSSNLQST
jgi:methylisocitrate lyase